MKIGIVARHLDLPVGYGTYASQLLAALAELETSHQFFVYAPHQPKRDRWPDNFTIRNQRVPQVRSRLAKWEHFTAPRAAQADGVDLLHYLHTANSIPRLRRPIIVGVLDAIGWVLPGYRLPLPYQALVRRDIAFASHIVTISEAAKQDIQQRLRVKPDRITVTPLAGPAVEKKAATKKNYFLFVGGTERRKNLRTVLEAFGSAELGRTTLKVVGPLERSPVADDWQELTDLLPAERRGRVEWLGRVTDRELAQLYRQAQALVFPSLYEGFGLPILEAMARRTPVIAGNRSSLPEVARDGAVLVDPTDAKAVGEAMETLLTDRKLAERLVRRGAQIAADYSWRHTAELTLALYEKLGRAA